MIDKRMKPEPTALLYGEPAKALTINYFQKNLSEFEIHQLNLQPHEIPTVLRITADILEKRMSEEAFKESKKDAIQKAQELGKG